MWLAPLLRYVSGNNNTEKKKKKKKTQNNMKFVSERIPITVYYECPCPASQVALLENEVLRLNPYFLLHTGQLVRFHSQSFRDENIVINSQLLLSLASDCGEVVRR